VNLGEKEPTKTYAQPDIVGLRDELIDSILTDMTRIGQGAALPALGEGKACEYCAARGLCRKDFWS
jgi:ATP-dependent helicase/nuclease subunit B